jgi:hypothetical protein
VHDLSSSLLSIASSSACYRLHRSCSLCRPQNPLGKLLIDYQQAAVIFFGDHPVPPKDFLLKGGDIFMDLSAHDIDYILQV